MKKYFYQEIARTRIEKLEQTVPTTKIHFHFKHFSKLSISLGKIYTNERMAFFAYETFLKARDLLISKSSILYTCKISRDRAHKAHCKPRLMRNSTEGKRQVSLYVAPAYSRRRNFRIHKLVDSHGLLSCKRKISPGPKFLINGHDKTLAERPQPRHGVCVPRKSFPGKLPSRFSPLAR